MRYIETRREYRRDLKRNLRGIGKEAGNAIYGRIFCWCIGMKAKTC